MVFSRESWLRLCGVVVAATALLWAGALTSSAAGNLAANAARPIVPAEEEDDTHSSGKLVRSEARACLRPAEPTTAYNPPPDPRCRTPRSIQTRRTAPTPFCATCNPPLHC